MGGVASSKVCCCWHNSSTKFRPLKSKQLAVNLENEDFLSARDGNLDLQTQSARSPKVSTADAFKGNSSTRGTHELEASELFASVESSVLRPSNAMWHTNTASPIGPEGSDVDPTSLIEEYNESSPAAVKQASQMSQGNTQMRSYTSTSADGGTGVALSSYTESADPAIMLISRGAYCPRDAHASAARDLDVIECTATVIRDQLRLLDIEEKYESPVNEIWQTWYMTEARRFYSASSEILRARKLADDWFAGKAIRVRSETSPTIEETLWIYRFVKARQGNVSAALEMLKSDLTWREEANVEVLSHEIVSQSFKEALLAVYPHGYYGCDKIGRPIYYDRLGSINAKKLLEEFSHQEIERYWVRGYELLLRWIFPACSVASGRRIYRGITILDLYGVSMGTFTKARELLNVLITVSQNHYPECMEKTYIIRSGWAFRAIWRLIKPLLSPETAHKVHFVESGLEMEVLAAEIESLPPFIANPDDKSIDWCLNPIGPWLGPMAAHHTFPPM